MLRKNTGKIRVLVVDDSAFVRKTLSAIINSDDRCEVIATAKDGEEAIRDTAMLRPDVVMLDVELPKMDGITVLKHIMSQWPTPVVMVTAYSEYSGVSTIKCLEYGAVDIVSKPSGPISVDIDKVKYELLDKIKTASKANVKILRPAVLEKVSFKPEKGYILSDKVVAIGCSTGGPRVLVEILPRLKPEFEAGIVIAQHMPGGFTRSMAERFNDVSEIIVKEAEDGDFVKKGEALIGPGGFNMVLKRDSKDNVVVKLARPQTEAKLSPSVNQLMESVASLYGRNSMGIVLTGMGTDGTEGLRAIKKCGGHTVAEDKSTCIVYGMPKSVCDAGVADKVLPAGEIAGEIMKWARR